MDKMYEQFEKLVSTHSRPKAAGYFDLQTKNLKSGFNTQPPEGGWIPYSIRMMGFFRFQHTAARRRLGQAPSHTDATLLSFNTQPPEGGWRFSKARSNRHCEFQHTAARRRLGIVNETETSSEEFQHTAARRRLVQKMK